MWFNYKQIYIIKKNTYYFFFVYVMGFLKKNANSCFINGLKKSMTYIFFFSRNNIIISKVKIINNMQIFALKKISNFKHKLFLKKKWIIIVLNLRLCRYTYLYMLFSLIHKINQRNVKILVNIKYFQILCLEFLNWKYKKREPTRIYLRKI